MKRLFLLLFTACISFTADANEKYKGDSLLNAYYDQCVTYVRRPEVIAVCDTLFRLSVEQNNINMQGTAMVFTFDYYYSQNNLDSMQVWISRIERFARANNDLKPLYFAWNQLIRYYISMTHYTLAQYELEKLLQQAKKDDYKMGIAQAYNGLGNIYLIRDAREPAKDYFIKTIDYILENNLDKYLVSSLYEQLASIYSATEKYDEALKALDESEKYNNDSGLKYKTDAQRAVIYAKTGNTRKALVLLQEIEKNRPAFFHDMELNQQKTEIFLECGMYKDALEALESQIKEYEKRGYQENFYSNLIEIRASIFAAMGDKAKAYDEMTRYVKLYKEKTSRESENTLGEFATLMGVDQLNREKTELEHNRTQSLIGALVIIIILAIVFIIIQMSSNRKLKQAKQAAEEVNLIKGEFIRHVTHEVNTPLNAIVGFAELLITTPSDDPERLAYIDIIHKNSDYLQKLIDDTLYISDLESSDTMPKSAPVDINECLQHALRNISHLRKENVEIDLHPITPVTICLPKQYIIKVITELIGNALTFTKSGKIEISCSVQPAQQLTISVADTGCGIATHENERIFERFVKLNSFSQGLGLGLSVCRMIARCMGGDVQLDTSYRGGARFLFTLPLNSKKQ